MQQHEIIELRTVLASIADDEERLEKAEKDMAHAELCIRSANARLETARARVKELTGDTTSLELLKKLAAYAEQYGRRNQ